MHPRIIGVDAWLWRERTMGDAVVTTSLTLRVRIQLVHLQVVVRVGAVVLDPSLGRGVPAGHVRQAVFIDLPARLVKGRKLRCCVLGASVGHGSRGRLIATIRGRRHPGIVVLMFRTTFSTRPFGTASSTAATATGTQCRTAADTLGDTPEEGEEDERADDDTDDCRPPRMCLMRGTQER